MRRILRYIAGFRRNEDGLAYLEFGLALPFLLALFMGGIEITRYVLIAQKVEKASVTIADVVAQGETITTTQLNSIVTAGTQIMLPFTFGARGYVIITSVSQSGTYSAANPPRIRWQYTSSGTNGSWTQVSRVGTGINSSANLPGGLTLLDRDNVIIAEVFYNYSPMLIGNDVIEQQGIYKLGLYKPRLGALSTLSALPFMWIISEKGAVL